MDKINCISKIKNTEVAENDLYRRFKLQFDTLLSPTFFKKNLAQMETCYVEDPEMERRINDVNEDITDTITILTGQAGCGKSTLLNHCFCFINATILYSNDILIFPANYNGRVRGIGLTEMNVDDIIEDIKKNLTKAIKSMCLRLLEENEELQKLYWEQYIEDFFCFFQDTNGNELNYITEDEKKTLPPKKIRSLCLTRAERMEPFIFYATELKFLLSRKVNKCKKLIIILDDIDPLPQGYQIQLIMQYIRFYECLRNVNSEKYEKEFLVNMIFSVRPETYRNIMSYYEISAYAITRIIEKKKSVDLWDILEKKFDFLSRKPQVTNIDAWRHAYNILKIVGKKFNKRYSSMIKNLSEQNLREAQINFLKVLSNRSWIQKNALKEPEFTIYESDYVFNNITVIRALTCSNYFVYKNHKDVLCPNLFIVEESKDYCLISLHLILYLNRFSERAIKDDNPDIAIEKIIESFRSIFSYLNKDIWKVIYYFFERKIIIKSLYDKTRVNYCDAENELAETSLVHLSSKGAELWNMFHTDSVYLELCREDYPRDYSKKINNSFSSFELLQDNHQDKIFLDLLIILSGLLEKEEAELKKIKKRKKMQLYQESFGSELLVENLMCGVIKSIEYSGKSNESVEFYINQLNNKIETIKENYLC